MANETLYVKLPNGKKLKITGETNKYWLCSGTQFRKANASLEIIKAASKKKTEDDNHETEQI